MYPPGSGPLFWSLGSFLTGFLKNDSSGRTEGSCWVWKLLSLSAHWLAGFLHSCLALHHFLHTWSFVVRVPDLCPTELTCALVLSAQSALFFRENLLPFLESPGTAALIASVSEPPSSPSGTCLQWHGGACLSSSSVPSCLLPWSALLPSISGRFFMDCLLSPFLIYNSGYSLPLGFFSFLSFYFDCYCSETVSLHNPVWNLLCRLG